MTTSAARDPEFADRPWMQGAEPPTAGEARTRAGSTAESRRRNWAALAHGSGLLALLGGSIPLLVVAPLLIWQVVARRDEDAELAESCVEALNFQVNLAVLAFGLAVVLVGLPLVPLVLVAGFVLSLVGMIRAFQGQPFRYPFIRRPIRLDAPGGGPPPSEPAA
jgi:uncharacterized Tic20 family protein